MGISGAMKQINAELRGMTMEMTALPGGGGGPVTNNEFNLNMTSTGSVDTTVQNFQMMSAMVGA